MTGLMKMTNDKTQMTNQIFTLFDKAFFGF